MTLPANAFVSLSDLKTYLNLAGSNQDAQLEVAIGAASGCIESYLKRQIPSRGAITEYHSLECAGAELYLGDWPIVSVTSVNEDSTRTYGSTGLLVVDTDYIVSKRSGKLVRAVLGGGARGWLSGFRTVKVVYLAGYMPPDASTPAGATAIPEDLRLVCLEVAAAIYSEADRKRWGVSAVSDAMGNLTRYLGYMTQDIRDRLAPHVRREVAGTWDRDTAA